MFSVTFTQSFSKYLKVYCKRYYKGLEINERLFHKQPTINYKIQSIQKELKETKKDLRKAIELGPEEITHPHPEAQSCKSKRNY
jgi:hypothetical protein